jgi:cytochrome c553
MKSIWLVVTLFAASVVLALAQQQLPEGDGKKLVEDRCASCHTLEPVLSRKATHDEWRKVVVEMVGYGARLNDKEIDLTVEYLTRYLGVQNSGDSQTERTAKRFIEGICSSCHDSDFIKGTEATKDEWMDIVRRMNGKGAGLSETDVELLADYLAKNYGRK